MTARQRAWLLPPSAFFLIIGVLLGRQTAAPWLALIACVPLLAGILLSRGLIRWFACLLLSMAVGTMAGSLAWHPTLPPEGDYDVEGVISEEIRYGSFGQVRVELTNVRLNGTSFSSGVYWTFYVREEEDLPDLAPGRFVSFRGKLYHPDGADNPDGYDFREDLLRRGITVCIYGCDDLAGSDPSFFSPAGWTASLRHRLTEAIVDRMGEETGAYTAALLLGQRSLIPSEDRDAFARLGIAHILSVSGFHVGILAGILGFLFHLLHLKPRLRFFLFAGFLALYCALCGMNQPVVRASLLLLVTIGGKLLNRPRSGLHSLCAVLMIMLLISPVQLTGASFQLTFAAVLGIVLISPEISRRSPFRGKLSRKIWESFSILLGVQIGLLLPQMFFYQKLPLLGLLINIPGTLFSSAMIALDWLILIFLPVPAISDLFITLGAGATRLLTMLVRRLADIPGITLWVPSPSWLTVIGVLLLFAALCVLFRLSWKVRSLLAAAGLAAIIFSLFPSSHTATEYIQFSVGNADAAVLWDQQQTIVLDTGLDDGVVSGFLRRRRLTPDAVILTHLHTDHAGGLRSMIRDEIPIRVLYLPAGAEDQLIDEDVRSMLQELREGGTEIRYLAKGDVLPLPSGDLTVLWPESGKTRPNQDANHYSLVSLIRLNGVSFLQTGDITGEYEHYSAVPADLLKAPHHGSPNSSSEEYLSVVSPRVVLLSCRNETRHEDYALRLPEDTALYSTARSGALTLRFEDNQVTVIPYLSLSP